MAEWTEVRALSAILGAPADVDLSRYGRKVRRTMGRVALLALHATDQALAVSGLPEALRTSRRTGLFHGSTQGSTAELEAFCGTIFATRSLEGLSGSAYLKFMSHTTAANLAQHFGITGPVVPTNVACASSSQAIGLGFEAIRAGRVDVALCGGAEELHHMHSAAFDLLYAASTHYADAPERTPRPFDAERDGLVVGEGAGTLVLEERDHALARRAPILAELLGFGNTCDGTHVTAPSEEGMASAMVAALEDAGLAARQIDYVNAHGTATELGDIAESRAMAAVLGPEVPVSSTKGFTGHTLGACGAIEAAFCLAMMEDGFVAPNRNLDALDPRCAQLDYVREVRPLPPRIVMTNNFAFGGINTSLILRRPEGVPAGASR
jgi:3-oxoacyl-[acyl-carrier-protein] synthase II